MCRAEDRIGSGAVPRLFVQKALRGACRGLIDDLGGATVLDLLEVRSRPQPLYHGPLLPRALPPSMYDGWWQGGG